MTMTRRDTMKLGLAGISAIGLTGSVINDAAAAPKGDSYDTDAGPITVTPIGHASFVLQTPGLIIYNDPIGGKARFEGQPAPDLILITHEHPDHFELDTLTALVGPNTRLITNPSVLEKLPEALKANASALKNGDTTKVDAIGIEAVPAYNTTPDRLKYHPKGRDNGYVLTVGGKRVYIAGDTEDTLEMRAQKDVFIAFVPMNLPFTMTVDQAASAVAAFKPKTVYPYHYKGSDPQAFADKVKAADPDIKVVLGAWYA